MLFKYILATFKGSMANQVKEAWLACQIDDIESLKTLVPEFVSPDASTFDPTNHVHTLLMCAASHGSVNCCEYLIEQNAEKFKKNFSGYTALHWSAYTGRDECLTMLLSDISSNTKLSPLEYQTEDGKTALHIASLRGHLNFIKRLLSLGADLNSVSSNGWTALHYALTSNQKDVCRFFLSQNINAKTEDAQGKNVFDIAEQYSRKWFRPLAEEFELRND